jgi:type VI secretion system protein VasI
MKKNISILLMAVSILIVFSTLAFALENVKVKDYIEGKFPVIFNIYLASLGELDQDEREFIDLLQNLPEEDQKRLAKEVYENGFSEEILEDCRRSTFLEEEQLEPEIEEEVIDTGKWLYSREINPMSDKLIITFTLKCETDGSNEPIFLIIKKEGKNTLVFIDWSRELRPVFDTTITVWTRLDDNKVSHKGWNTVSDPFKFQICQSIFGKQRTSSQYTFYPGREVKFIKKIMSADRFIAELRSFSKMSLTAIFDVRGLRDAVEQFDDILDWTEE